LGFAQDGGMETPRRALSFRAVRARQLSHAFGKVRVLFGNAGAERTRSVAGLRGAARVCREQSGARAKIPAGSAFAAGAKRAEFVLCQFAAVSRYRKNAAPRH